MTLAGRHAWTTRLCAALIAALVTLCAAPPAVADKDTERQLKALRGKIEKVNARIARDVRRRDDGLAELKKLELDIQAELERLYEAAMSACEGLEQKCKSLKGEGI